MNSLLLNTEIQAFIDANLNADISDLLLKGINFNAVNAKDIIEQIEAKNRSQKKLPTWFNTKHIYYPNKLNIEQTSSETTAKYKSELITFFKNPEESKKQEKRKLRLILLQREHQEMPQE